MDDQPGNKLKKMIQKAIEAVECKTTMPRSHIAIIAGAMSFMFLMFMIAIWFQQSKIDAINKDVHQQVSEIRKWVESEYPPELLINWVDSIDRKQDTFLSAVLDIKRSQGDATTKTMVEKQDSVD